MRSISLGRFNALAAYCRFVPPSCNGRGVEPSRCRRRAIIIRAGVGLLVQCKHPI